MAREYPQTPLVGIGVVVLRGEEVLLIRRARPPRQGEWSLPGGLQQLGETVFDAAVREVREETAVLVRPLGVVDVVDLIERDGGPESRVRWHYTLIDVAAAWAGGEPRAGDDATDAAWVPLAAVAATVGWGETVRIVEQAYRAYHSATAT